MSVNIKPPKLDEGLFCAPSRTKHHGTCFDRKGLLRIIEKYNKYSPTKIKYTDKTSNEQLWNLIRNGLENACHDQEWCWLDQDFLKNDQFIQQYYKPPRPTTKTKWLSTHDIDDVLKQFENEYPDFMFMGAVPIDFDEVIEEYKNMNVCPLISGGGRGHSLPVMRYGFVFNLDQHDQRGSHWVCMFLNLLGPDKFIGYFDSYGILPPIQIKRLIERLKKQIKNCLGIDVIYKCNTTRHQHKGTECGVYCLYFIYQCLTGNSFESITETLILDDDVNKFRRYFFRPSVNSSDL